MIHSLKISRYNHTIALFTDCIVKNRMFSAIKAKDPFIPIDKLEFNFVRSSGPGMLFLLESIILTLLF